MFELPHDELCLLFSRLPPFPSLFACMGVCSSWRGVARKVYIARHVVVPAEADALLQAVEQAQSGDTLLLESGTHELSAELVIAKPLKLIRRANPAIGETVRIASPFFVSVRVHANTVLKGLVLLQRWVLHPTAAIASYGQTVIVVESGCVYLVNCKGVGVIKKPVDEE